MFRYGSARRRVRCFLYLFMTWYSELAYYVVKWWAFHERCFRAISLTWNNVKCSIERLGQFAGFPDPQPPWATSMCQYKDLFCCPDLFLHGRWFSVKLFRLAMTGYWLAKWCCDRFICESLSVSSSQELNFPTFWTMAKPHSLNAWIVHT